MLCIVWGERSDWNGYLRFKGLSVGVYFLSLIESLCTTGVEQVTRFNRVLQVEVGYKLRGISLILCTS